MSKPRELHCYQYAAVPYPKVAEALRQDATGLLARATATAESRAHELVSTLRVAVGALEIGADIKVEVRGVDEKQSPFGDRRTEIELRWAAVRGAGLFPSMEATLSVYPLSSTETQIDLHGRYRPPLGAVGNAVDALVGHRIAEAAVLRLVNDLAARLGAENR
jgi:hypothetical protein